MVHQVGVKIVITGITLTVSLGIALFHTFVRPLTQSDPDKRYGVFVELTKTQYEVGEEIPLEPHLIYKGRWFVTTITYRFPLFLWEVFDEEGKSIYRALPGGGADAGVRRIHLIQTRVPFKDPGRTLPDSSGLIPGYHLYLSDGYKPGRYKLLVWAEFWEGDLRLWEGFPLLSEKIKLQLYPPLFRVYAKPVWFEVIGRGEED